MLGVRDLESDEMSLRMVHYAQAGIRRITIFDALARGEMLQNGNGSM